MQSAFLHGTVVTSRRTTRGEDLCDLDTLQQGEFGKGVVIATDSPGMIDVNPHGTGICPGGTGNATIRSPCRNSSP